MYKIKRFSALTKMTAELKKNPVASAALLVSTANATNNIAKARRDNKLVREKESFLEILKSSSEKKKRKNSSGGLNIVYL